MAEPQFNPIMQLQPQQGFTNNYYRTAILQVPQNDLQQIGAALAPFSQSLGRVMRQDRIQTNEKEAEAGAAEAALLTTEQRRLAAFANWKELERTGVIAEGASPARLIAMNEHAGRSLVEDELQATLQNNIVRYSDPSSSPDQAIQFAQEELMKLGIQGMSHYAKAAAAGSFERVSRAWLNQVGQRRVERTARENREQLTSDVFRILDGDLDSEGQRLEIQERVQDSFNKTGLNGRLEVVTALEKSAMSVAEDDLMKAMTMIATVEGLEIGGVKMREQYGDVFATLEDRVQKISEASEDENFREEQRQESRTRSRAMRAASELYDETGGFVGVDVRDPAIRDQIREKLGTLGVPDEQLANATTQAIVKMQSLQKGNSDNTESLITLTESMFDEDTNKEDFVESLNNQYEAGRISSSTYLSYLQRIENRESTLSIIRAFANDFSGVQAESERNVEIAIAQSDQLDEIESTEYTFRFKQRMQNQMRVLAEDDSLSPTQRQNALDEFAEKESQKIVDQIKEQTAESEPAPASFTAQTPETFNLLSPKAEKNLEALQSTDTDEGDRETAKGELYSNATKLLESLRSVRLEQVSVTGTGQTIRKPGRELNELEQRRDIRFRAITGFTIEEIKSLKTENGVVISKKELSPFHTILVPNMESTEQFKDFAESVEGREQIAEILKALPGDYQFGTDQDDFYRFVRLQADLLNRYRANPGTPGNN